MRNLTLVLFILLGTASAHAADARQVRRATHALQLLETHPATKGMVKLSAPKKLFGTKSIGLADAKQRLSEGKTVIASVNGDKAVKLKTLDKLTEWVEANPTIARGANQAQQLRNATRPQRRRAGAVNALNERAHDLVEQKMKGFVVQRADGSMARSAGMIFTEFVKTGKVVVGRRDGVSRKVQYSLHAGDPSFYGVEAQFPRTQSKRTLSSLAEILAWAKE